MAPASDSSGIGCLRAECHTSSTNTQKEDRNRFAMSCRSSRAAPFFWLNSASIPVRDSAPFTGSRFAMLVRRKSRTSRRTSSASGQAGGGEKVKAFTGLALGCRRSPAGSLRGRGGQENGRWSERCIGMPAARATRGDQGASSPEARLEANRHCGLLQRLPRRPVENPGYRSRLSPTMVHNHGRNP